jgi:O-methyltransferase domain/Dimerisation domain
VQIKDPRIAMNRLLTAYRQSQALAVAVALRLPERLADRPRTAADLAAECDAHEPSLRRLLRTLVAMEVAEENIGAGFRLTILGEQLREDLLGPGARLFNSQLYWKAWLNLEHSVRTGERAFDLTFGMRDWDYYATHAEEGALFDAAMAANTGPVSKAVVAAYDFSPYTLVADIGGGDGTLLGMVLRKHLRLRGVLFDRQDVIERARVRLRDAGVADRVEFVGGSFFESIPSGADAFVMKSIIHDWEDASAGAILARCRDAASDGTRLLLVERVLPEKPDPDHLEFFLMDLNMLVQNGGKERTEAEYRVLLERAGWRLTSVVETDTGQSVLESVAG